MKNVINLGPTKKVGGRSGDEDRRVRNWSRVTRPIPDGVSPVTERGCVAYAVRATVPTAIEVTATYGVTPRSRHVPVHPMLDGGLDV